MQKVVYEKKLTVLFLEESVSKLINVCRRS